MLAAPPAYYHSVNPKRRRADRSLDLKRRQVLVIRMFSAFSPLRERKQSPKYDSLPATHEQISNATRCYLKAFRLGFRIVLLSRNCFPPPPSSYPLGVRC